MNTLDPRKPWTTKLSSAGLVYAHFGRSVRCTLLFLPQLLLLICRSSSK